MGKDLESIKSEIKFVSPNEEVNSKMLGLLKKSGDCFGVGFLEDDKFCVRCTLPTEWGDRRAPLFEFCKEVTQKMSEKGATPETIEPTSEKVDEPAKDVLEGEKKPQETKKVVSKKTGEDVSPFGHKLSTQSGFIDSLLLEGTSIEAAENRLSKQFSDYKQGRVKGHMAHLKKDHGAVIEDSSGVLKIKS